MPGCTIPVPEMERRRNHLSLIADAHPMLGLVRDCLKDKDTDRPTTQHLCQRLSALKEAAQYSESQQEEEGERGVGATGVREREREGEVEGRERALEGREREVEGREREVERRETELGEELHHERSEKERLSRRLDMTNFQVQQMQEGRRQVENQLRDEIQQIREEKDCVIAEKDREREQLLAEKDGEREQLLAEKDGIIHSYSPNHVLCHTRVQSVGLDCSQTLSTTPHTSL